MVTLSRTSFSQLFLKLGEFPLTYAWYSPIKHFLSLFFKFILRETETAQVGEGHRERERERERERTPSRLCAASAEPDVGLEPTKLWDHDLSWNQEPDVCELSHLGALPLLFPSNLAPAKHSCGGHYQIKASSQSSGPFSSTLAYLRKREETRLFHSSEYTQHPTEPTWSLTIFFSWN